MKKLCFLICILICSFSIFSQSDIIYPAVYHKVIKKCEIINIKKNAVTYTTGSGSDTIEAIAVFRNSNFISLSDHKATPLYKNYDYNYYAEEFNKAMITKQVGIWITGGGVVLIGTSILNFSYCNSGWGRCGEMNPLPYLLGIFGIVNTAVGIALWTRSSIQAANHKKAMELTKPKMNLSLVTTSSGIGFKLTF